MASCTVSVRQNFVPDLVSVDQNHVGITRRHPAGHRTLSRTDPPDNSENGNVRVIWHEPSGDGLGEENERLTIRCEFGLPWCVPIARRREKCGEECSCAFNRA